MFSRKKTAFSAPSRLQKVGNAGESEAAAYLEKQGFKIIERNFKCKTGEVDLIVTKGGEIHFVEVKTRRTPGFGSPAEQVTFGKRLRLSRAAQYYRLGHRQFADLNPRFSVIGVNTAATPVFIDFIENAFEIEGEGY